MSSWQNSLRRNSYSRSFIWKTAIALLALGVAAGAFVSFFSGPSARLLPQRMAVEFSSPGLPYSGLSEQGAEALQNALVAQLENTPFTLEDFIALAPFLGPYGDNNASRKIDALLESRLGAQQSALIADFLAALTRGSNDARQRLETLAEQEPPTRYANRLLGEIEAHGGYYHKAYPYFEREGRLPEAAVARERAVAMLVANKKYDALQALLRNPDYAPLITPRVRLDIAIHQKDWLEVARLLPWERYSNFDGKMLAIAAITALVWAIVLFRLGQFESWTSRVGRLSALAFVAGVLSTLLTVFLVIIENAYVGYQPDGDFVRTTIFFIGGVGLREEFCKLLFFLPFAFHLAKRGDERAALIVASFVGLGFAAEENVGYFSQSLALAAPGRFLTANFLHIALTGMGGLYLCRAIRSGSYNDFLYAFALMIIVHGLYNSFLFLPQAQTGGFLSIIIFILLSMQYFRELSSLGGPTATGYSLSFLFVSGLCLILSTLIVFQASQVGLGAGLQLVTSEALGSALIVFMFFREFNEALGP